VYLIKRTLSLIKGSVFIFEVMMSVITYQNRGSLLKNSNVKNLTGKQIVCTNKFIQSALKRYGEADSARIIWLDAGFEIEIFKKGYFRKCLNRWR
jgi:hypothetical protein